MWDVRSGWRSGERGGPVVETVGESWEVREGGEVWEWRRRRRWRNQRRRERVPRAPLAMMMPMTFGGEASMLVVGGRVGLGAVGVLGSEVEEMVVRRVVGESCVWRVEGDFGGMVGWVGDGWGVGVDMSVDVDGRMDVVEGVKDGAEGDGVEDDVEGVAATAGEGETKELDWSTADAPEAAVVGGELVRTTVRVVKKVESNTDELDESGAMLGVRTTAVLSPGMLKVMN